METVVFLNGEDPDGVAIGNEGNAHGGTFSAEVSAAAVRAAPGLSMGAPAAKCPTLIRREDLVGGEEHSPFG